MADDLIQLLIKQAKEIGCAGHNGWGNTMLWAAYEIKRLRTHRDGYSNRWADAELKLAVCEGDLFTMQSERDKLAAAEIAKLDDENERLREDVSRADDRASQAEFAMHHCNASAQRAEAETDRLREDRDSWQRVARRCQEESAALRTRIEGAPVAKASECETIPLAGGNHFHASISLLGPAAKTIAGKRVALVVVEDTPVTFQSTPETIES